VFFSLPQQTLPDLNKGMAEGQLPVDALNADGKGLLDKGNSPPGIKAAARIAEFIVGAVCEQRQLIS
jgi:hypothetical protein